MAKPVHIPVLRQGRPYVSLEVARVPHFRTKETFAEMSQANPGLVRRDLTPAAQEKMRERLARLNPQATTRMAQRLLEANDRGYWQPDDATLDALRDASDALEDRLEGVA